MIARDMAALLWSKTVSIPITKSVINKLTHIHSIIANPTHKCEKHIGGQIIPCDPQFTSCRDACLTAEGAFCDDLEFWFDIHWSPKTKQAINAKTIHIKVMEFTLVILQLVVVQLQQNSREVSQPCQNFLFVHMQIGPTKSPHDQKKVHNWSSCMQQYWNKPP
jgi:hypothetical protein